MSESIMVYHHNGSQITITDIPVAKDENLSFQIMTRLQKQIDEINYLAEPKSTYCFK
jgi:hypothetical protein